MSNPLPLLDGLTLRIDSSTTDDDSAELISVSFPTSASCYPESDGATMFVCLQDSKNKYLEREQREDWAFEVIHCPKSCWPKWRIFLPDGRPGPSTPFQYFKYIYGTYA